MAGPTQNTSRLLWIGGIGLAVLVITALARYRNTVDQVPWRTNYEAGMAEAQRTNKPVLLDFSATWCGPCQEMKRETWSDSGVGKALNNKVPIAIDVDQRRDLVEMYRVQGFPTMILLSPSGMPLKEQEGFVDADGFLTWLHGPTVP